MTQMIRKRFTSWSQYYELKLFDLWEEYIEDMRPESGLRMKDIYQKMAKSLDEAGFIGIEWTAVRCKLDNITRKYRMEAKQPTSIWIHFNRVHKILKYWKPKKADETFLSIKKKDQDAQYLSEYLDDNASCSNETLEEEPSMELLSNSESLNDDQLPSSPPPKRRRKPAAQGEMTAFEAGMLEATRERNEELRKMRMEITDIGHRRLDIMERVEKTLRRIEESNSKFHQQILKKKS